MRFVLGRPDIAGPLNLTAPHPVTNSEFTEALNAALGRPAVLRVPVPGLRLPGSVLHVPTPALRLALGEMAGEVLASARVLPRRPPDAGYPSRPPAPPPALASALSYPAARARPHHLSVWASTRSPDPALVLRLR